MTDRVKAWLRGALEAFLAMLIYTVALGACMALLLLIISIEEGGPSLSMATVALTETITLLTQGCGFTAGALTLTVIPLSLTALLIWIIRSLVGRLGISVGGCFVGLVVWTLFSLIFMQGSQTIQVDTTLVILLRTSLVFLLGYGWAWVRSEPFRQAFTKRFKEALPVQVRKTIRLGLTTGLMLLAAMLVAGLITLIIWIILYNGDVGRLFKLTRMGAASAAATSLAALAWLPNLIIWAASWLFGDGFNIGRLATFTLWSGHASSLPSLPLFGIFPEPVSGQEVRLLLLNLPLLAGVVAGILLLTGPCRASNRTEVPRYRHLLPDGNPGYGPGLVGHPARPGPAFPALQRGSWTAAASRGGSANSLLPAHDRNLPGGRPANRMAIGPHHRRPDNHQGRPDRLSAPGRCQKDFRQGGQQGTTKPVTRSGGKGA